MATQQLPNSSNKKPKKRATWFFFYLPFLIITGLVILNLAFFFGYKSYEEHLVYSQSIKENVSSVPEPVESNQKDTILIHDTVKIRDVSDEAIIKLKVSSSRAYLYTDYYEHAKTEIFAREGEVLEYLDDYGEYYNCKYKNKDGIVLNRWVKQADVERIKPIP